METVVLSASVAFVSQSFIKPLLLSSGAITEITEARATVRVRVQGKEAEGIGSIYLSDLWSWPDPSLSHEVRDARLREFCQQIADNLAEWVGAPAHPLELGLRLHDRACHGEGIPPLPTLALAMCMSPFDAAIHDAVGHALGRSAFSFYTEDVALPTADPFFSDGNACRAIRNALLPADKIAGGLDAWWIVGAKDELPAAFEIPVAHNGYHGFKIKLLAKEIADDVARTIAVYDAAKHHGCAAPRLSLDSNEGNKDAQEVVTYLRTLQAERPDVYNALEYLEQPTGRDITVHRFDWKEASALKPILLDEGLTDLSLLPLAQEQGWSGLALKTCKGHSFTLVAAAWARERGLPLAMQDLTNPGYAAIHSYLIAAHLGTINGIELNSAQYTPAANEAWLPRLSALFQPKGGQHKLCMSNLIGTGSSL